MRLLTLAAVALLALLSAAAVADDSAAVKADVANLQGTWKVVRAENNGADVKDRLGYDTFIVEGKSTKVIFRGEERKSNFEIDPSKQPKQITYITPKGTEVPGIYELDGDHWKVLSRNAGRPTSWDDPGGALMVYERVKATDKPTTAPARTP